VQLYSYSECENEAPRPINDEPVEIERDVPETADTLFEHFNGLFGMAMKAKGIGVEGSGKVRFLRSIGTHEIQKDQLLLFWVSQIPLCL
jgi:hypothetical protein